MKNRIFFIVANLIGLMVLCHQLCISQTAYSGLRIPYDPCPCTGIVSYGNTAYFNLPEQVASDFGRRFVDRMPGIFPYDWHGGIDFNTSQGAGEAQRWWMIVSPQAGIIADFDKLTHGVAEYKYGLLNVTDDEGNGSHTWAFWSCI